MRQPGKYGVGQYTLLWLPTTTALRVVASEILRDGSEIETLMYGALPVGSPAFAWARQMGGPGCLRAARDRPRALVPAASPVAGRTTIERFL